MSILESSNAVNADLFLSCVVPPAKLSAMKIQLRKRRSKFGEKERRSSQLDEVICQLDIEICRYDIKRPHPFHYCCPQIELRTRFVFNTAKPFGRYMSDNIGFW